MRALLLLPFLALAGCSVCTPPVSGVKAVFCESITPAPDPGPAPDPEPQPTPEPAKELVFTPGQAITRQVSPAGGSVSFEAWVPESGRADDWGAAELLMIYDADRPRAKVGRFAALLPYKVKACVGASCREPRYNREWSQWHKVLCTWGPDAFGCTIDGEGGVWGALSEPWGPRVTAVIGCAGSRCLDGAKVRGVKWE